MNKLLLFIMVLFTCLSIQAVDLDMILSKNENMAMPPASTAEMRMVITNKAGQSRTREIKAFTQSIEGEVNKQMLIFTAPADVRNTRFLTIDYDDSKIADEQAIYMPALRKIRTIGSSGGDSKTGAFLGSDFSYADIGSLDLELFSTKLLGQESFEGEECYKVEYTAKGSKAIDDYGYSKVVKWISTKSFSGRKSEFYNKNGKLVKRMIISGIELIDGKYWQFKKMQMFNLESGGNTLWEFTKSKNMKSIKDSYFTKRYLERGR
ncbi:MAG: outer membrane lipoprotein-sorting protein [Spirochaetaceae bacterium]